MHSVKVGAVILAAGQSRRMGQPKMTLPWGKTSVVGQVANTLLSAQVDPVVVVCGGGGEQVAQVLSHLPVALVYNPEFAQSEMLVSLQLGIRALPQSIGATLVCLGDQPQIELDVVLQVLKQFMATRKALVVPSFQMRRGHPWLVARSLWDEIVALGPNATMRHFMQSHHDEIEYVNVQTPSILKDIDTPEDYAADAPKG